MGLLNRFLPFIILALVHPWTTLPGLPIKCLQPLGAMVRVKELDVINSTNFVEDRCRSIWGQKQFQLANDIVNCYLNRTSTIPKCYVDPGSCFPDFFPIKSDGSIRLQHLVLPQAKDSVKAAITRDRRKKTFAITVAYRGSDFCGWQTQSHHCLPSVQESLETHLSLLQKKRVDVRVCGRTDAGVHAIGQVCRYRTELDLNSWDVQNHLDLAPFSDSFRCLDVQDATNQFHPAFAATCRAYAYVMDASNLLSSHRIQQLDTMLREIENKTLDYFGFSYGKRKTQSTDCTIFWARAIELSGGGTCIQLVGDRFLRRMIRILVSTAIQCILEDDCDADADADAGQQRNKSLIPLILALDRTLCPPPAPPGGLIFVGAKFLDLTQH